jgi:hypothetical protein
VEGENEKIERTTRDGKSGGGSQNATGASSNTAGGNASVGVGADGLGKDNTGSVVGLGAGSIVDAVLDAVVVRLDEGRGAAVACGEKASEQ